MPAFTFDEWRDLAATAWARRSRTRACSRQRAASSPSVARAQSALPLLNGEWRFSWAPRFDDRPPNTFAAEHFDDSSWVASQSPATGSCMAMVFPSTPTSRRLRAHPAETKYKAQRLARLQPGWCLPQGGDVPQASDGAVYLTIGAVTSAVYVYVNGEEVGYSQDSKLPAEFDVTRYVPMGRRTRSRCSFCAGATVATWRIKTVVVRRHHSRRLPARPPARARPRPGGAHHPHSRGGASAAAVDALSASPPSPRQR